MAQASPDKPPANGGQHDKNSTAGDRNAAAKATAQKNTVERNETNGAHNAGAMGESGQMTDPIAMLKEDHRKVERLFDAFEKAENNGDKSQLAAEICKELMIHSLLEEEIFYAECRDKMDDKLLNEAQVEHDGIKPLIMEIMAGSPEDPFFEAKVKVLSEDVKHHVREEEKGDGILAKAKQAGVATPELAKEMGERKQELMEEAESGRLRPPRTRSFRVVALPGPLPGRMARPIDEDEREYRRSRSRTRYEDDERRMPPRDEEGRFMSTRSRYDEDEEREYRRPRSRYQYEWEGDDRRRMPPRDEEGRFRSRSRYDEDDDYRRGRGSPGGHGGWYGDPRGHSEAARRGWEEHGETGSRSRYDDDEDDEDRRGRGGHGGWFGDPRGHAEAARRGWEERESRGRYDEDDDDDRRRGRSRR
ncbi:MAG: hemerythrin domain-containing protein [Thiohalocapsa sp.]